MKPTAITYPLRLAYLGAALLTAALLAACGSADAGDGDPPPSGKVELRYEFADGDHGWEGGFTDYSPAHGDLRLDWGIAPLPGSLEQDGTGLRIVGMNGSDDLFMFLKRRVGADEGLQAGQAYRVGYRLVLASDAPTGCFGVGGPPGEGVFLKAGASVEEPRVVLEGDDYQLTIDKDNQASGGRDVWLVGDIANGVDCEEAMEANYPHVQIEREYTHDASVTADADGNLWLIVGTDSGFEGLTELFYQVIEVTLEPVDA